MADEVVKITGIEEVQKMLAEAPKTVVATAFLKGLRAAANVIEGAVAARTPVETGDLKEALVSDIALDSQYRGGHVDVGFGKQGHIANFVEYGHRMVSHKPTKKELGIVSAHPFMRPAADVSADAAIEAFADALEETLREGLPNG